MYRLLLPLAAAILFTSNGYLQPNPALAPFSALGSWRGTFELRPGVEVPFNFDIHADKHGQLKAYFRNGSESFEDGPVKQTGDSLFIFLDQFDNELAFKIGEGPLTGTFSKQDRSGTPLAVKIEPNSTIRFENKATTTPTTSPPPRATSPAPTTSPSSPPTARKKK
jgi:hypothetical protein